MTKQTISVGIANETAKNFDVEVLKTWAPKNITPTGDTIYFQHEGKYYSMKAIDFNQLYKK